LASTARTPPRDPALNLYAAVQSADARHRNHRRIVGETEYTPLFGFMESGYRFAVVLTLAFDVMSTVFLGTFVAVVAPQLLKTNTTKRRLR
jgi:hypothetical protein